jgi:hypothetical protein
MPRYHFHVQHGDQFILDREGVDLPNLRKARGMESQAAQASWEHVLSLIRASPTEPLSLRTNWVGLSLFFLCSVCFHTAKHAVRVSIPSSSDDRSSRGERDAPLLLPSPLQGAVHLG